VDISNQLNKLDINVVTLKLLSTTMTTRFDGFATMYMRMPMSTSALPIQGQCTVDDRRVTLKFPFTGIEFELPSTPATVIHGTATSVPDLDFKIRGARGDLLVSIAFVPELRAFTGVGRQDDDTDLPVLSFCFFAHDSPLSHLPRI